MSFFFKFTQHCRVIPRLSSPLLEVVHYPKRKKKNHNTNKQKSTSVLIAVSALFEAKWGNIMIQINWLCFSSKIIIQLERNGWE